MKKIASLIGCAGLAAYISGCAIIKPPVADSKNNQDLTQIITLEEYEKHNIEKLRNDFANATDVFIGTLTETEVRANPIGKLTSLYAFEDILCAKVNGEPAFLLAPIFEEIVGVSSEPAPLMFRYPGFTRKSNGKLEPIDIGLIIGERAIFVSKFDEKLISKIYVSHYHFRNNEQALLQIVKEYERKYALRQQK